MKGSRTRLRKVLPEREREEAAAVRERPDALLDLWIWDGTLERIHHALYVAVREQAGRDASPITAIIDSQSVKGAQKGGPCSTRRASMRARRSRVASGISSSIRSACC